jgi:hypothetical protein
MGDTQPAYTVGGKSGRHLDSVDHRRHTNDRTWSDQLKSVAPEAVDRDDQANPVGHLDGPTGDGSSATLLCSAPG